MMKRLLLQLIVVLLVVSGCTAAGSGGSEEPTGPAPVRLSDSETSNRDEADAARLYLEARDHLEMGDWQAAGDVAGSVVDRFPATRVSGDALWLYVQAFGRLEAGGRQGEALDGLGRLIPLLPQDDRRQSEARLLRARLLIEAGRRGEALAAALDPRIDRSIAEEDLAWFREVLDGMSVAELEALVARAPAGNTLVPTLWVQTARAMRLEGNSAAAIALAERAMQAGVRGVDLELAQQLAQGDPLQEELDRHVIIAAILPQSGSPSMRRLAAEVEEGIRAAIEAAGLGDLVELSILDDGGDPGTAASLVQAAERQGAVGVVGPLGAAALAQAASARSSSMALVSPTSFDIPAGMEGVYSLSAFDPGGVEALAQWSASARSGPVAIIHPSFGSSAEEARAFAQAYRERGGEVLRLLPYDPGTTFFETQIRAAIALRPAAVLLPIPVEDVAALAPQVTFFGLDTLGIRIMGTGGWTDPVTLDGVSVRHLTGVVAATPDRPRAGDAGWDRFQSAYEQFYRRTFRGSAIQALGYDATSLLLAAVQSGARTPEALNRAMDRLQRFSGATGALSVTDGRIARTHDVVCFNGRDMLPALPGRLPVLQYRAYPRDPETDSIPEGPGRKAGFLCPQVAPRDTVINPR